jgi:WD40 repeat protein
MDFLAHSARQHRLTNRRASEALADRALAELDRDPELATLLAIAAVEDYGPSARAILALSAAVSTSIVRIAMQGHEGGVSGVAFSPDGTRLATAADDRAARVWDVAGGAELLVFRGHEGGVSGVAFSPDGSLLATACDDHLTREWDIETDETALIARAKTLVSRELSEEERSAVRVP